MDASVRLFAKVARRFSNRGPSEWLPLIWKNLVHSVTRWRPSAISARWRDRAFDRRWGTRTSGLVNLSSLTVDPVRARQGVRYQASGAETLAWALEAGHIDPSQYTFIDYGAGKGRIVMSASSLSFRRVIGVEFSAELCELARDNIERFGATGGSYRNAEIIHQDAGSFKPPHEPLVCYFYNPFGASIMLEVIEKLEQNLSAGSGDIKVIYVDPKHLDLFTGRRTWEIASSDADVVLLASVRRNRQS